MADLLSGFHDRLPQPLRCRLRPVHPCAAAGAGVDGLVQQRLAPAAFVQSQVRRHHVLPGPVQKRHFPAAVGSGELRCFPFQQKLRSSRRQPGIRQATAKSLRKYLRQAHPLQMAEVVQHEGVSGVTVDRQQAGPSPQGDYMEVPAESAVWLLAVEECLDLQMPLEWDSQAQFGAHVVGSSFRRASTMSFKIRGCILSGYPLRSACSSATRMRGISSGFASATSGSAATH